ncbi:MAG: transcription antitermination factor NusB [Cyclobacteriaceae bacterium]|nr:transcription antitermination factor NusB [Cyclobacteriaceae bacterium]
MLNRRSLRIKVMQSLFAFHQSKEASYLLSQDYVERAFELNLNSMEVQDKKELSKKQKEAVKLFQSSFKERQKITHEDQKIQDTVKESLKLYDKTIKNDLSVFGKSLVRDVEKIYAHYLSVLSLAIAFAEVAEADKKINHTNFLKNDWILAFRQTTELKKESSRMNVSWDNQTDRVRLWLRDVVKQDPDYMAYLDKNSPSREDQKKAINHFFKRIILGKTSINDFYEEEVLRWAEDREIVKGMVEKTVKSFDPSEAEQIQLHALSLNWEDDLDFMERLFSGSASLSPDHQKLIADNTRNWEVERLPLTDRVILEMAITELITFPSIPVKVTINEYIELAKNYSTPKSRQFINGILDVISKELKTTGNLKKSGRGLMDNK